MSAPTMASVAFASARTKQKLVVALLLSSGIPLLVLAYLSYVHLFPLVDTSRDRLVLAGLQALIVCTALVMFGGGYMIWRLASAEAVPAAPSSRQSAAGAREAEEPDRPARDAALKDTVTGLYSRRFLLIRLEEEIGRHRRFAHPISLVLLEIDDAEGLQQRLGGDGLNDLLRASAQILLRHSRGINVLARYRDRQFGVLLIETAKAGAHLYADRIRQVIATSSLAHGISVTASFGVAGVPEDTAPAADELVRCAEDALAAAQREGSNVVRGYRSGLAVRGAAAE